MSAKDTVNDTAPAVAPAKKRKAKLAPADAAAAEKSARTGTEHSIHGGKNGLRYIFTDAETSQTVADGHLPPNNACKIVVDTCMSDVVAGKGGGGKAKAATDAVGGAGGAKKKGKAASGDSTADAPAKTKREPTAYNLFMKDEVNRIKEKAAEDNTTISHKEAFSIAATNWSKKRAADASAKAAEVAAETAAEPDAAKAK